MDQRRQQLVGARDRSRRSGAVDRAACVRRRPGRAAASGTPGGAQLSAKPCAPTSAGGRARTAPPPPPAARPDTPPAPICRATVCRVSTRRFARRQARSPDQKRTPVSRSARPRRPRRRRGCAAWPRGVGHQEAAVAAGRASQIERRRGPERRRRAGDEVEGWYSCRGRSARSCPASPRMRASGARGRQRQHPEEVDRPRRRTRPPEMVRRERSGDVVTSSTTTPDSSACSVEPNEPPQATSTIRVDGR